MFNLRDVLTSEDWTKQTNIGRAAPRQHSEHAHMAGASIHSPDAETRTLELDINWHTNVTRNQIHEY